MGYASKRGQLRPCPLSVHRNILPLDCILRSTHVCTLTLNSSPPESISFIFFCLTAEVNNTLASCQNASSAFTCFISTIFSASMRTQRTRKFHRSLKVRKALKISTMLCLSQELTGRAESEVKCQFHTLRDTVHSSSSSLVNIQQIPMDLEPINEGGGGLENSKLWHQRCLC